MRAPLRRARRGSSNRCGARGENWPLLKDGSPETSGDWWRGRLRKLFVPPSRDSQQFYQLCRMLQRKFRRGEQMQTGHPPPGMQLLPQ